MRRVPTCVLATVVLGVLGACAAPQKPISLVARDDIKPEDYDVILDQWTREDRVYQGLESKLFVFSTFHSPEFRKVFLLRHPDVYGPGSEVARRLALTAPEADEAIEFFFSASTTDAKWNDFEKENSIWRVTLTGDDGHPVDGKVVRLKTTANLRVMYPYITDFARTYAVRFPRTDAEGAPVISSATKQLKLQFASALGRARLVWDLVPVGKGPPK